MDTEETIPSKSKKFFKITLGVFGALAVLLGIAFVLAALKNAKQAEVQTTVSTQQKALTQEELQLLDSVPPSTSKDIVQNKTVLNTSLSPAQRLRIIETLPPPPGKH